MIEEEKEKKRIVLNEKLSNDIARKLSILASPKKYVVKEKGKPIEDFFFSVLRCVDEEKYGSLNIMNADPRWSYVEACVDVLKNVLNQMKSYNEKVLATKLTEDVPILLFTTEITNVVTLIEIIIACLLCAVFQCMS